MASISDKCGVFFVRQLFLFSELSMSVFKSIILGTVLTFGLVGCATAPKSISPDVARRIKRIAPISAAADNFTRQYVGLTVFGNEREEKPIADWAIDRAYEEQLASEIQRTLGLTAIRAPYSVSEFAHVNDLNGPYYAPAFWGPNWDAIGPAARAYCSANSLDALLVVAKQTTGDFLAGTNQHLSGAGIYVRGPGDRISVMHLLSRIGLIDCVTGKPLAIRTLTQTQDLPPRAGRPAPPLLALPGAISRMPIPQWTKEMQEKIRSDLIALPRSAWTDTIKSMFPPR